MSHKPKKQGQNKFNCYADFVVDVPQNIENRRYGTFYERLHFIGAGSYGRCFEVVKQSTKERFACKVLSKAIVQDSDLTHLVQNEISIHRKLKHEHVIEYIQSFDDEKFVYIIQSLCVNQSLRELQKSRGTVLPHECRYFISQILKGAEYIHENRVIHRDLKLSNILIDKNMQMKICDFGLSIRSDDPHLENKSLCGTANYLAPEVVSRKGFVCRSDVWAVGVIAFVLLYGYKPFEEADVFATYQRIMRADYRISSDMDTDLKFFFRNVFEKDVAMRCSASECLKFSFFKKYDIPTALPIQTFTKVSFSEFRRIDPSCIENDMDFANILLDLKTVHVVYPEVQIITDFLPKATTLTEKVLYDLNALFTRFDDICRHHMCETEFSFNDINELCEFQPAYWIAKWSYGSASDKGFAYEMSDGSKGMLFHDGHRLIRTPDLNCRAMESGADTFCSIRERFHENRIQQFNYFEEILKKNGSFKPETSYNQRKIIFLYTWLKINDAMIMVLSNGTVQINFVKLHQKVVICPSTETITFIDGMITMKNFRTITFESLARSSYSLNSIQRLKYITAIVMKLVEMLKKL